MHTSSSGFELMNMLMTVYLRQVVGEYSITNISAFSYASIKEISLN